MPRLEKLPEVDRQGLNQHWRYAKQLLRERFADSFEFPTTTAANLVSPLSSADYLVLAYDNSLGRETKAQSRFIVSDKHLFPEYQGDFPQELFDNMGDLLFELTPRDFVSLSKLENFVNNLGEWWEMSEVQRIIARNSGEALPSLEIAPGIFLENNLIYSTYHKNMLLDKYDKYKGRMYLSLENKPDQGEDNSSKRVAYSQLRNPDFRENRLSYVVPAFVSFLGNQTESMELMFAAGAEIKETWNGLYHQNKLKLLLESVVKQRSVDVSDQVVLQTVSRSLALMKISYNNKILTSEEGLALPQLPGSGLQMWFHNHRGVLSLDVLEERQEL